MTDIVRDPYGNPLKRDATITTLRAEVEKLRAEVEKLRAAIEVAVRQHEDGNKGLAHRTLCEAVYGEQA